MRDNAHFNLPHVYCKYKLSFELLLPIGIIYKFNNNIQYVTNEEKCDFNCIYVSFFNILFRYLFFAILVKNFKIKNFQIHFIYLIEIKILK